jgi:DtxR family Mn-dependent transcriptional regulator
MPTPSVENYLKAVYHLEGQGEERVSTTSLAEELDISHSSVTNMLKSLAEDGLVDYEPYNGARLTDDGIDAALKVIRNHRLIEIFLVDTLDYSWDEVHEEAERLEHAVSERLAERIDAYLDHPKFDPHGDPIPTADGEMLEPNARPLDEVDAQSEVRIERVLDQDPDVLRYLDSVGLVPNASMRVVEILPVDGQMTLQLANETLTVSKSIASRLLVTDPAEDGE